MRALVNFDIMFDLRYNVSYPGGTYEVVKNSENVYHQVLYETEIAQDGNLSAFWTWGKGTPPLTVFKNPQSSNSYTSSSPVTSSGFKFGQNIGYASTYHGTGNSGVMGYSNIFVRSQSGTWYPYAKPDAIGDFGKANAVVYNGWLYCGWWSRGTYTTYGTSIYKLKLNPDGSPIADGKWDVFTSEDMEGRPGGDFGYIAVARGYMFWNHSPSGEHGRKNSYAKLKSNGYPELPVIIRVNGGAGMDKVVSRTFSYGGWVGGFYDTTGSEIKWNAFQIKEKNA